jgi:hypothetical protein
VYFLIIIIQVLAAEVSAFSVKLKYQAIFHRNIKKRVKIEGFLSLMMVWKPHPPTFRIF